MHSEFLIILLRHIENFQKTFAIIQVESKQIILSNDRMDRDVTSYISKASDVRDRSVVNCVLISIIAHCLRIQFVLDVNYRGDNYISEVLYRELSIIGVQMKENIVMPVFICQ